MFLKAVLLVCLLYILGVSLLIYKLLQPSPQRSDIPYCYVAPLGVALPCRDVPYERSA